MLRRILDIADFKGVSANELSKIIGVSNAYFSQQKKNKGDIGAAKLLKIVSVYPDISPEWLLTGKGSMLREGTPPQVAAVQAVLGCTEQLAEKERIIGAFQGQIQAKDMAIQALQGSLKDKDTVISNIEKRLEVAEAQITDLQKDKKSMGKSLTEVRSSLERLKKTKGVAAYPSIIAEIDAALNTIFSKI